jgi:hypothetical protein
MITTTGMQVPVVRFTRAGFIASRIPAVSSPSCGMPVNQMLCDLLACRLQACQLAYTHDSRWHVQGASMRVCLLQACVFPA